VCAGSRQAGDRQQTVVCKFTAQKRHGAAERQQRRASSAQQAAASDIKRQTGSRQTAGSRSRQTECAGSRLTDRRQAADSSISPQCRGGTARPAGSSAVPLLRNRQQQHQTSRDMTLHDIKDKSRQIRTVKDVQYDRIDQDSSKHHITRQIKINQDK